MARNFFPERFHELVKLKNVKIADMAEELDISKKSLYNFMRGIIFPSIETIAKIADYLEVSTDYLLGRVDEPTEILLMEMETSMRDEIFFIRKSYQKMDEAERRIIHTLIKSIMDEKEKAGGTEKE